MEQAESGAVDAQVDRRTNPWLLSAILPPHVKMEFPAPVFGHGFGPPTLDILQSTPIAHQGETNERLKIKSESSMKNEPASSPGKRANGAADSAGGTQDGPAVRADSEDGCSRTMARFSQIWLAKWQQRRQLVKNCGQQQEAREQQVISPGGHSVTDEGHEALVRSALIRPQLRQSASPVSGPIGITVGEQSAESKRASPAKPIPQEPVQVNLPSAVPSFSNAQLPYAPPVFNPAVYPNWSLWPDYAGFWPGHGEALGYPSYPLPPAQAPGTGVIHHHHVPAGGAGTPTASPLLLIPCLDPYQRPAMFWTPTCHHHPIGTSAGATWTLPELHPPTPATNPWPILPRPFEVPALIHSDLSAPDFVASPSPLNLTDDVKSIQSDCHLNGAASSPDEIKHEPVAAEVEEGKPSESADEKPLTAQDSCITQTIRVRDNLIDPNEQETGSYYSGLQLLSDSIERYVSRAPSPVTDRPSASIAGGSALDVLCAAALLGEREPAELPLQSPVSPAASQPISACSEKELCFRSKLAELQRIYKEKQKILKHLKPKRKDKSEKKKKSSEDRKKKHSNKRRRNSSGRDDGQQTDDQARTATNTEETACDDDGRHNKAALSDLISPGRLELDPSTRRPPDNEDTAVLTPNIATSYAAALVSAAVCTASSASVSCQATPEKKKRKAECPVRKHDTEHTETIVPNKKRKFIHLFTWCQSSSTDTSPVSSLITEANGADTKNEAPMKQAVHQRHKMKPKLRAELKQREVQINTEHVGHESNEEESSSQSQLDSTAGKMDDSELLERQCLPALQLLQLIDDETKEEPELISPSQTANLHITEKTKADETQGNMHNEEKKEDVAKEAHWHLAQEDLRDGLRVLIAEHGMLVAGTVTGICPPDIYGVAVDGERGCRPRILSTEELLKEAVPEIRPVELDEVVIGTRVCAYWSHKSRVLYPGVVSNVYRALPSTGRSQGSKEDEIDVEFDDGDSGRMPISLIRLLPQDYPVTDRDPNPLLKLECRRTKRRSSETLASTQSTIALIAKVKQSDDATTIENNDETKKAASKKKRCEESKENNDSRVPRTHNKKQNKKQKDADVIIPVSPGLANDEEKVLDCQDTNTLADVPGDGTNGSESSNKMADLIPKRQLWEWLGPSFKKASKGKGRKEFYKAIHRGDEIIRVGDCAIFLSAGRQDRPYVGRIELLWQSWGGSMTVKVRWFYHPEETCGGHRLSNLKTPGALFESNHIDENDVQTISHCCTVSSLEEYRSMCRGKQDVNRNVEAGIELGCDHFYLAGFYDPTSGHLSFEPGVLEPLPSTDAST